MFHPLESSEYLDTMRLKVILSISLLYLLLVKFMVYLDPHVNLLSCTFTYLYQWFDINVTSDNPNNIPMLNDFLVGFLLHYMNFTISTKGEDILYLQLTWNHWHNFNEAFSESLVLNGIVQLIFKWFLWVFLCITLTLLWKCKFVK